MIVFEKNCDILVNNLKTFYSLQMKWVKVLDNFNDRGRIVFEQKDFDFIENEAYMWSQARLAKHYKINVRTFTRCIERQPEFRKAYDRALKKRDLAEIERVKMHKERITTRNASYTRYVLDKKDMEFIQTDGAFLSKKEIAAYFKISEHAFNDIMQRQPEVMEAYQQSVTKKKLEYHKIADDKITGKKTDGDTALLLFQLKTRCKMAEVLPEGLVAKESETETPEQKAARMEDIKLFTEWKRNREKERIKKNKRKN